ncbi:sortase [Halobacillus halophilus]|uniref:sortase n=1 Tax=Halobacillus halophilus TaxID=1570 RepID=UPI001CD3473D|nr:sortase [Halobacillus halophilus]MCA1010313.1 sortase [Halobacillus halophilus]
MIKKLSILLIGLGMIVTAWNAVEWWNQSRVVSYEPELKNEVHKTSPVSADVQKPPPVPDSVSAETFAGYEKGENIGELTIPKLGKRYPVYYGSDEDTLTKGVGMYDTPYTNLPSEGGHTALAGHRETTFVGLDQLSEGDSIYLTENEVEYEYVIQSTWITDAEDRSVIVPETSSTLTLTTCYPFDFIGSAPDRFIVQAELAAQKE